MAAPKKIGMILECSKRGADIQVCKHAASRIAPTIEVDAMPMDNKRRLLRNCGDAASILLRRGSFHVLIIWDLFPSTHGQSEKPCRAADIQGIKNSLKSAGVALDRATLVCIEKELEAWLIADHRAVNSAIKDVRPHKKPQWRKVSRPDHEPNPKKRLIKIFQENLGHRHHYVDHRDAIKIAEKIEDCRFVSNSPSFQRFAGKLKVLEETLGK